MLLYSKLYFSNKTIVLFLKKPYLVCTTLILIDSNIRMEIQISPNINQEHLTFNLQKQKQKLSTFKNKNFEPSKTITRTFNLQIL
jgi:hypothetical protein